MLMEATVISRDYDAEFDDSRETVTITLVQDVAGAGLIVTVDTMIAHLAGALGKPVWLLLKSDPDWRWPLGERWTPLYPSMRVYAQPRAGDWEAVLAKVLRDLAVHPAAQAEER